MAISKKQKKYLRQESKNKSLATLAKESGLPEEEIKKYFQRIWRPEKYKKFIQQNSPKENSLSTKVSSFSLRLFLKKHWRYFILLFILVLVAYANSINNEFLSDDISSILKNKELNKITYISRSFPSFFRPMLYFFINKIFGRTPAPYRLLNILFHLGTTFTVFPLVSLLTNPLTGFITATIFAVHPVLVESVTWISGGPYTQYAFLSVFAILLFLLSLKKERFYPLFLTAFCLALLTSEKAIVLPFLLIPFFLIPLKELFSSKNLKNLAAPFAIGLAFLIFYLHKIPERVNDLTTNYYQGSSPFSLFELLPHAIAGYFSLIFWPQKLTLYHSETSFTSGESFLHSLVFFALLALIFYFYQKKKKINFYFLSFFLISLAPVLTPFGISWWLAERYVYLGSIGIFALVAMGLTKIIKKQKLAGLLIWGLIIVSLTARTIRRNIDWKNQDNLWIAAAKTSPSSPQNHNNLGDMYYRHQQPEKAIEEFQKAIELNPRYAAAYHNLANVYHSQKKYQLAIENYQKATSINPHLWQSWQNLASIYFNQKAYKQAEEAFKKSIEANPQNIHSRVGLAIFYLKTGEKEKAKEQVKTAIKIDPNNPELQKFLSEINSSPQSPETAP